MVLWGAFGLECRRDILVRARLLSGLVGHLCSVLRAYGSFIVGRNRVMLRNVLPLINNDIHLDRCDGPEESTTSPLRREPRQTVGKVLVPHPGDIPILCRPLYLLHDTLHRNEPVVEKFKLDRVYASTILYHDWAKLRTPSAS